MIDLTAALYTFSRRTGVSAEAILGTARRAEIVAARQLFWLILRDKVGASWTRIADFCDVTHPSVLSGVKNAREKLEVCDKLVCDMWELVEDMEV